MLPEFPYILLPRNQNPEFHFHLPYMQMPNMSVPHFFRKRLLLYLRNPVSLSDYLRMHLFHRYSETLTVLRFRLLLQQDFLLVPGYLWIPAHLWNPVCRYFPVHPQTLFLLPALWFPQAEHCQVPLTFPLLWILPFSFLPMLWLPLLFRKLPGSSP